MRGNRPTPIRWVSLATVLLLLAPSLAPAGSASPSTELEQAWHVDHDVNAMIVDNYATVTVAVTITNDGPAFSFPFEVDLPEKAFVTNLTITRNATTYVADIEPRQQAREDHQQAKREGRTTSIVERHRDDSVYRYNVNVGAAQTVRAALTYELYLTADRGVYELDLTAPATQHGIDEGASFDVRIRHGGGLDRVWSNPSAQVYRTAEGLGLAYETEQPRNGQSMNLDVHYTVQGTPPGGRLVTTVEDGTGYFAHRLRAQADQAPVPLDISLVLDTSGSMHGQKIQQLQAATRQLVDALGEQDRLHVTAFDDEANSPWPGFAPVSEQTRDEAKARLANLSASGSTNIGNALRQGFQAFENATQPDETRVPALVFLTDGRATAGIEANGELRELAREANRADAHVFSLAFGQDADWSLVHGLAEDADGFAQRVEADRRAEVDLEEFLTALTAPVLENVRVDYAGEATRSWRVGAPVLFAGSELLYVGTFDPNRPHLNATVRAQASDGNHTWNVTGEVSSFGPAYLPDLVAYERVRDLEARIDAHGPNETWVETAKRLALSHGFVTERTSLQLDLPRPEPTPQADGETDAAGGDASASQGAGGGGAAAADVDRAPTDTDGDGIPSASDNCPNTPNPRQTDSEVDGVGDACQSRDNRDADGDGVANYEDDCPGQAGPAGNLGCPQAHDTSKVTDGADGSDGQASIDRSEENQKRAQPSETPSMGVLGTLLAITAIALASRYE